MTRKLDRKTWIYVWTVACFGVGSSIALIFLSGARFVEGDWKPVLAFGLLTVLTPFFNLYHRGDLPTGISLQLSSAFGYPLFFLVDPWLVVIVFWAHVFCDKWVNRRNWVNTAFNLGQMSLACSIAAAWVQLFDLHLHNVEEDTVRFVLLSAIPMTSFALLNHGLTHCVVRFASQRPVFPLDWFSWNGLQGELAQMFAGIAQPLLWVIAKPLALLALIPIAILFMSSASAIRRETYLQVREKELHSLQGFGLELGSELDRHKLFHSVLRITEEAVHGHGALILTLDKSRDLLRVESSRNLASEPPEWISAEGFDASFFEGGEILLVDPLDRSRSLYPGLAFLAGISALIAPLEGHGLHGLLVLTHDHRRRRFSAMDRRRLKTLIRFVNVSWANSELVADLKQMQTQLVQNEKMFALGQLVAGVAHELNNPLTAILGYSELLERNEDSPEKRRMLDRIDRETRRAAKIVKNLLTFSRKHPTDTQRVNVNEIIQDTLEFRAYDQAIQNIVVLSDLSSGNLQAMVDPHQLQQVLLNLLTNAEQAVREARRAYGEISIQSYVEEQRIRIEISDNGVGIQPEDEKKVFDPFFTTKKVGEGTGLGLSICYGIIEHHGGTISVKSHIGKGTTFTIELPCAPPVAADEAQPQEDASRLVARPGFGDTRTDEYVPPGKLLVVDDEESISYLVTDYLEPRGWSVARASEGRQALDRLAMEQFDLLLVDLRMPGMNGKTFCELVERYHPEMSDRIVIATGERGADQESRKWLESRPHVLLKPYDVRDLMRALARAMRDTSRNRAPVQGTRTEVSPRPRSRLDIDPPRH